MANQDPKAQTIYNLTIVDCNSVYLLLGVYTYLCYYIKFIWITHNKASHICMYVYYTKQN